METEMSTIYVGDLDPSVFELDIVAAFAGFGFRPVTARLCRDRLTGASLRYAYLNFASRSHAANAMTVMNHSMLKGRPMRIMWSMRDPLTRKNGVGNLFVKNLEAWMGALELEELFREYGTVVSCKVELDDNGNSKGFGFIQMSSEESAKSAIIALHGKILNGGTKELYVSSFIKKTQRQALPQERKYTNLYIKNLDEGITDELLRAKFSEFGKICSAVVMKDELGKSRGFGFVSFELLEQASKAMKALNNSIFGSHTIYVGYAQKKAEREELLKLHYSQFDELVKPSSDSLVVQGNSKVYVKYLSDSVDDKDLLKYFSLCGKVKSAKVWKHANGMSKGFGFVDFESAEDAKTAVVTLHGTLFHDKLLYAAMAMRKEERQRKLDIHFADKMAWAQAMSSYSYTPYYPLSMLYPRNYVHVPYQGYRYLYPLPLHQKQQCSYYPQYAALSVSSSQLQQSAYPTCTPSISTSSQLQQHPIHTVNSQRGIWSSQPTKHYKNWKLPAATVRITYPKKLQPRIDEVQQTLLDGKVQKAVKLCSTMMGPGNLDIATASSSTDCEVLKKMPHLKRLDMLIS